MTTLTTEPLAPLLDRLFSEAEAPGSAGRRGGLARMPSEQRASLSASTVETDYRSFYSLAKDAYLAVDRETAVLLYMLVRSTRARSIVEFGTSFGISTLHFAAGLRDNGGGRVITTEFEPSKAARARENFVAGGLADLIELREGDALETLAHDLPDGDRRRVAGRRERPLPPGARTARGPSEARGDDRRRQRRPDPSVPGRRALGRPRVHVGAVRRRRRAVDAHRLTPASGELPSAPWRASKHRGRTGMSTTGASTSAAPIWTGVVAGQCGRAVPVPRQRARRPPAPSARAARPARAGARLRARGGRSDRSLLLARVSGRSPHRLAGRHARTPGDCARTPRRAVQAGVARRRPHMTSASRSDLHRPSDELIASATSADLRQARALLDADPALARHDLACACVTGEADEASRRLPAPTRIPRSSTTTRGCRWRCTARRGSTVTPSSRRCCSTRAPTRPTSGTVTTATKSSTTRVSPRPHLRAP